MRACCLLSRSAAAMALPAAHRAARRVARVARLCTVAPSSKSGGFRGGSASSSSKSGGIGDSGNATRMASPPKEYRLNVGITLINKQGLVFCAQRLDDPDGYWQMPQGGVDIGEDTWEAALRELREETGVVSVRRLGEVDEWIAYDFPPAMLEKLSGYWRSFRGQAQKWYLVQLEEESAEAEIDISGLGEAPEFREWRWAPLQDLPGAVIPFKKEVYEAVVAEFQGLVSSNAEE